VVDYRGAVVQYGAYKNNEQQVPEYPAVGRDQETKKHVFANKLLMSRIIHLQNSIEQT